jgi:hypothetical protein
MGFDHKVFALELAGLINEKLELELAPLRRRVETLEQRDRALVYRGVWVPDQQYFEGNFATFDGSLWHCNRTTRAKPGDGTADWQLAAKRGANGKDGVRDANGRSMA